MEATIAAKPFVKWAGGKRSLLKTLDPLFPPTFDGYYEPFVGGGAVFFYLAQKHGYFPAILGDVNEDLMATYAAIQKFPDVFSALLKEMTTIHSRDTYDAMRRHVPRDDMDRALRFLYLNRACFNGLWRENAKGQMNTPMGDTPAEKLFDFEALRAVHHALQGVGLKVGPFYEAGFSAPSLDPEGWFIYLDPPYHRTFSNYSKGGFGEVDHIQLARCANYWSNHGAKVMVSNSDTEFVRELYRDWNITEVQARRSISADRSKRGRVGELVIRNYQ